MTKQLEDQRKERKRLEEVILEKDSDIQGLLQGGGNFQLIKSLLTDLNGSMNSIDDLCASSDSNTKSIKNFMVFLDEFSKDKAHKPSPKKRKPKL